MGESIVAFVVIIIVFNLINSLLKAIRGDQPTPRSPVPVKAEFPFRESPVNLWSDHADYSDPEITEDMETGSRYDQGSDQAGEEVDDIREIDQLKQKKVCRPPSVASGLRMSLSRKDPLVSAYIFYEIFEKSPAMRRRR